MKLQQDAILILRTLEEAGFEAYAVGGCVRDALLGLDPKDIDITTSARPEEVKALFPKTFDTGIEHGTVTVLLHGAGYEVTTFRTDGKYTDHRRPDEVRFASTLSEDLSRRDFTINAMAYHPDKGIIDLFGGREDLAAGLIRCVGRALERFDEDALRMLRAVRFAARLGFRIDEEALRAVRKLSPTLQYVSRERVWEELKKILLSPHPDYLGMLKELGLLPYVSPRLSAVSPENTAAFEGSEADLFLRTAIWLYPLEEEEARVVLRELKTDNELREQVCLLLFHRRDPAPESGKEARAQMRILGREEAARLLKLQKAVRQIDPEAYLKASTVLRSEWEAPVSLKELSVTGRDLIRAGDTPGKELGAHLDWLLDQVIEDPAQNNPETLIALLKQHWYNT